MVPRDALTASSSCKKYFISSYVCECFACIYVYVCTICVFGAWGSQKRTSEHLHKMPTDGCEPHSETAGKQTQVLYKSKHFQPLRHRSTHTASVWIRKMTWANQCPQTDSLLGVYRRNCKGETEQITGECSGLQDGSPVRANLHLFIGKSFPLPDSFWVFPREISWWRNCLSVLSPAWASLCGGDGGGYVGTEWVE